LILIAALSGIQVIFSNGVSGQDVEDKALPPDTSPDISTGAKGCWRAHMNAVKTVVEQNLSTALIIEDDIDWDIRIKSQLEDFAQAVRTLTTPKTDGLTYADPTFPIPRDGSDPTEITFSSLPPTLPSTVSPYGDNWDLLWLGHCGTSFPEKGRDDAVPQGRVIIFGDQTVPAKHHHFPGFGSDELTVHYPNHTRVIHHTAQPVCTFAYAVTQRAARQILFQMGVKSFYSPIDLMLAHYCDGRDGRKVRRCYTAQPQYFNHHRSAGKTQYYSEVRDLEKKINRKPFTKNIRWSMRMNLEKLTDGETELDDQYPDEMPRKNLDFS
jgi:GR25 family glycosyltransferase involved in LPS biosynthesis